MPALAAPKAKRAAKNASSNAAESKGMPKRSRWTAAQPAIGALQPKLRVNDPNDRFEREADHIADRVMSMPEPEARRRERDGRDPVAGERKPPLQRQEAEEEEESSSVQREATEEEETSAVQRQEAEEPEEEVAQTAALQRQEAEPEEEETAQTASLQRQEEEEEAPEMQRQEAEEEPEEGEVQAFSLQRQEEEEETPAVQRRTADEEEQVERRAKGPRPRISPKFETYLGLMRRSGGQPLSEPLRAFLEPRFHHSFSDVRVHAGPEAAGLARDANARAFTVGKHIVFGAGEYRPEVEQGRRLIAHELTHVLQQHGGLHSVQREVLAEPANPAAKRTTASALEELRELFQIRRSVVSPMILRIVEDLLRTALEGDLFEATTALLDAEASSIKRTIEGGGYTLEFRVNRSGGAGAAHWSLTRSDTKETFFAFSRELEGDGGESPGLLDEERLIVATPLPPEFESADGGAGEAAVPAAEAAPAVKDVVSSVTPGGPRPAQAATEIKSDALAAADASPEIDQKPPEAKGAGEKAGTDDPSLERLPIDEDPEAEQVPEEPPAEETAEEVKVERKAVSSGPPPQPSQALSAEVVVVTGLSGRPMPDSLRRFMELRLGAELGRIRLHDDARAGKLARSLGAKAFTRGEHIVFGPGHYQPATREGRWLIAHEISHVLEQDSQPQGRGAGFVQRQEEECPPPDPVPEVEVVPSPASPGQDPAFNQAENRIDNRAADQSQHAPGEEKSQSANAAAEVKEGEKQSHAQTDQVGKMDAEAQNPPEFDKEAFVAKVLAQVEAIAPGTLDDVMEFESRGKGGEVKDAVTGQVQESTDSTAGPLDEVAAADPGVGESPRAPGALEVEPPGAEPGSVRADRAMPPPRTESEVDMRPETVQTENILKEACINREFMEKHDDPELKEGIAAQDELGEASETKPQEFRDQEAVALADARAGASGEGAAGVQAMFGERAAEFGEVAQGQQTTKTDNEAKRDKAAEEINGIFTSTQEKVQNRLKQLDTDVMTTFDTEAAAATARWEASVRADAERYQKSWFDTAVDWLTDLLFDPPPEEVRNFYNEATQTFHAEMRVVIENIAGIVETGLKDARKLVEDGKKEVQTKLDGLGTDLEDFKQQISEEMNDKFRGLEGSIAQKEGELVQGLAQRYVKANERLKELEKQIREEYKNFLEKAADAYNAVKDLVVGQIEKLAALVGGAAKRIIKEPGKFLSNLGQGIIQGLTMFIGSIGENIKGAVVEWLTGNLGGAGIALPKSFDAKGIIGFLLELVGLGVAAIKGVARKVLGSTVVTLIEKGEAGAEKIKQIFDILASEGPAGLFRFLQAEFEQMKEQVLGEAGKALAESLVIAGIKKVLGIISGLVSGGVGTIITIVLTIIDVILWFRDNAARLAELVSTIAGTAMAILEGQVGVVASAINNVLKRLLPVVLGFVGALIGIGGAVRKIQQVFKAIKKPATNAITALFQKLKKTITKLLGKAKKGKKKGKDKELSPKKVQGLIISALKKPAAAQDPAQAIAETQQLAASLTAKYQPQLKTGTIKITVLDQTPEGVEKDGDIDVDVALSPGKKVSREVKAAKAATGALRASHDSLRNTANQIGKLWRKGSIQTALDADPPKKASIERGMLWIETALEKDGTHDKEYKALIAAKAPSPAALAALQAIYDGIIPQAEALRQTLEDLTKDPEELKDQKRKEIAAALKRATTVMSDPDAAAALELPTYGDLRDELTTGREDVEGRIAADAAAPKSLDELRADAAVADKLRQAADRAAKLADTERAAKPWIKKIDDIITNTTAAGRDGADVGDGSSEAAAEEEARTGEQIKGSWHGPKCREHAQGLADAISALEDLRGQTADPAVQASIDSAIERANERKQGLDRGWAAWNSSPYAHLAR
ncbi:MAG: DUF4157 domain-containing protein [Bryobacteraceae bacterium]